ncbi:MAG: transcription elongation factor GreB [Myxococcota bacterium]|nr:transcription elongation factor GreB [Myxococcota bacterium]
MGSYITPEGFERLRREHEQLWRVERPRVTHEVSEAAALGDRSENAEYIFGKKRLREIDKRLRFLQKRMDELTVVRNTPDQQGKVFFGAWVTVEDEEGEEAEYRLVGPDESDAAQGRISIESPLGRALMGKREDDEVQWVRPRGNTRLTIVSIRYETEGGGD